MTTILKKMTEKIFTKHEFVIFVLVILGLLNSTIINAQDCDVVTKEGVFNRTLINRNIDARNAFKNFQCSSNFQTHDEAINAGVSVAVPIYNVPVKFGGTFSESEKSTWKSENCSQSQSSASFQEQYQILLQYASPEILSAWLSCTISKSIGLQCNAQNADAETVVFSAIWNPTDGDTGAAPKVEGSFISGGSLANGGAYRLFDVGATIRRGQGNRVTVKRNGKKSVVMVLNTSRGDCNTAIAAPKPAPTPPPPPVYEMKWFKEDEGNRPYSQTFSHGSEDRNNRGGKQASGQYNIGDSSGRIYRVDFRCEGDFCGWNYNPAGQYAGNTTIIDGGRGFIWRRLWDGKPVTEFYTAYYEVQRRVCVQNCR